MVEAKNDCESKKSGQCEMFALTTLFIGHIGLISLLSADVGVFLDAGRHNHK